MTLEVILAGAGMGLLGGSEIAMMTLAATSIYGWRRTWLVTFAGLATLIPLGALLYYFFTTLPSGMMELAAGIVIFALGAFFFYKGIKKRTSSEENEHEEELGAGLIGIYAGVVFEGAEITTVIIALGAAVGAFLPAILGLMIGVAVPLATIRALKPLIERIPEWALQVSVGGIMMSVAVMITAEEALGW